MNHATPPSFRAWLAWPLAVSLCTTAALSVHAQDPSDAPQPPLGVGATASPEAASAPSGLETRKWLESQVSRKQASSIRQTLSGPVMEKVHERYVKSFAVAIPERLRENMSTGSK